MPATPHSVKFLMSQFGRDWAYIFYVMANSARDAYTIANGVKAQLIKVHDKATQIDAIATRDVLKQFPPHHRELNYSPQNAGETYTPDADVVTTSARVRLLSETGPSRFMWLRGIADSAVVRNPAGVDVPLAAWKTRLTALITKFGGQASPWLIRSKKSPTGDYAPISVLSIAAEPNTNNANSVFTLREPAPFAKGDRVLFSFDKSVVELLGYKNSHKVLSVAEDELSFTINARYRGQAGTISPFQMSVRWLDYDYTPILEGDFVKFGKKKTGSSRGPRGRAPGVSYRH